MNTCEKINNIKLDITTLLSKPNLTDKDYINYYKKYNIKYDPNSASNCSGSIGSVSIGLNIADNSECSDSATTLCETIHSDEISIDKCAKKLIGQFTVEQTNKSDIKNTCTTNIFKNALQKEKNHLIALKLYEDNKNLDCSNSNIQKILDNTTTINSINECLISNSVFQINVLTACRASNLDMSNISSITNKCIFNDIVENTHVVNPVIDPVVAPVVVVPVVAPVVAPPSKKPIPKNNNTLLIIISISIVFSIIIFSIIFFLVLRKYS